jgi:branched-subunit amino acid transport protein
MRLWLSALAVTAANWLMKASGPFALGNHQLPPRANGVVTLMAPALLAGLIVVELGHTEGDGLDLAQICGVGVAGIARLVRVPMLLAVVCGAAATALLRLL